MDIITKFLPNFLHFDRLSSLCNYVLKRSDFLFVFCILNSPLVYTIYDNTFTMTNFTFSYLACGILQGIINNALYYVSDVLFIGKSIDVDAWKGTKF